MTMIERVARALAKAAMEPFDELSRGKYEGDARAIIEAMREPTKEMLGLRIDKGVWQRMIGAALSTYP